VGRWDRGLGVREGGMGVIVVGFFFSCGWSANVMAISYFVGSYVISCFSDSS